MKPASTVQRHKKQIHEFVAVYQEDALKIVLLQKLFGIYEE